MGGRGRESLRGALQNGEKTQVATPTGLLGLGEELAGGRRGGRGGRRKNLAKPLRCGER